MAKEGNFPPTSIRIPPELKRAVAKRGEANRRTFSQEVIAAIEYYLANAPERFAHLEPASHKSFYLGPEPVARKRGKSQK
jgi:hypothetical protein